MSFFDRIAKRDATIVVVGLGHAGLPLAVLFAETGFRVVGLDIDPSRVEAVNRGESYVEDVPSETVARYATNGQKSGGFLQATTDYDAIREADAAIICVPTPLSKTRDPDMSYIVAATDEIARRLHREMLIVLESTTYPGTTEELILPRLEEADTPEGRLRVGRDFYLAFSPERIDPGRRDWTVRTTPKLLGGVTPRCLEAAQGLYGLAVEHLVPVSSPRVAETAKLLENTFRSVNIALVNEVAIMCDRLKIDVWEVIDAAKTKPFGFMAFYPGPGLGGHCIPIDPHYLAWKLRTVNYNARSIQVAADINFAMPDYVLGKIADALNDQGKPLRGSRVVLLGVTYKEDVADLRDSPALDLLVLLRRKGAEVGYHDPYVPRVDVDGLVLTCVDLTQEVLAEADCVVITTAHRAYVWPWVVANSRLIVDTRNATKGVSQRSAGQVVKL